MDEVKISQFSQVFRIFLERLGLDHCSEALKKALEQTNLLLIDTLEYQKLKRIVRELETLLKFNDFYLTNLSEQSKKALEAVETTRVIQAIQELAAFPVQIDQETIFCDLVQKCRFHWVSPSVNLNNFPPDVFTPKHIDLEIVEMQQAIRIINTRLELANRNLKPATLFEVLTFLSQYPDVEISNPLAVVARDWKNSHGKYYFPVIYPGQERRLDLYDIHQPWLPNWRVAAYKIIE